MYLTCTSCVEKKNIERSIKNIPFCVEFLNIEPRFYKLKYIFSGRKDSF